MTNKNRIPLLFGLGTLAGMFLLMLSAGTSQSSVAKVPSQMPPNFQPATAPHPRIETEHAWRFERPQPKPPEVIKGQAPAKASIGRLVSFTPPPLPDFSGLSLPRTKKDRMVLSVADDGLAEGQLELDPTRRDPMTSLGLCTRWIVKCVEPGVRSLDDCTRSAPICKSQEPWTKNETCCPEDCFDAYATLRTAGQLPIEAFDHVYFGDASCFPGVAALLEPR